MQAKDGASLLAKRTLNSPGTVHRDGSRRAGHDRRSEAGARDARTPELDGTDRRGAPSGRRRRRRTRIKARRRIRWSASGFRRSKAWRCGRVWRWCRSSTSSARAQTVETDRAPPGTIVDQNPEAGTLVVPPFTVTVFVARRPPLPPPPRRPRMPARRRRRQAVSDAGSDRAFFLAGGARPRGHELQLRLNPQIDFQRRRPAQHHRAPVRAARRLRADRSGRHRVRRIRRRGTARGPAAGRRGQRTHPCGRAESAAHRGNQRADARHGAAPGARSRCARGAWAPRSGSPLPCRRRW